MCNIGETCINYSMLIAPDNKINTLLVFHYIMWKIHFNHISTFPDFHNIITHEYDCDENINDYILLALHYNNPRSPITQYNKVSTLVNIF